MATLRISIDLDNAAFADPEELPRILRSLADEFETDGSIDRPKVYDSNGNPCGYAQIFEEVCDENQGK